MTLLRFATPGMTLGLAHDVLKLAVQIPPSSVVIASVSTLQLDDCMEHARGGAGGGKNNLPLLSDSCSLAWAL